MQCHKKGLQKIGLTTWVVTLGQEEGEIFLVPEIMIDNLVNKGYTKLNTFFVFRHQIKSSFNKVSKLNFWSDYTIKLHVYAVS